MSRRRGLGDCWSGTEPVSSPYTPCYCVFVCVWEFYVVDVGRRFVCVGVLVLQGDWSSFCYMWSGWMFPKTFVENWFWVPFVTYVLCVTVHSLCTQGSSEYAKFPRHFTEKCIWTWDWMLCIILCLMKQYSLVVYDRGLSYSVTQPNK